MEVQGKRVLITGGGRGIGAALAQSFAAAGARVAVVARTAEEITAVAAETGGVAIQGDVRSEDDCKRMV
jgi:NAD(P)-dependent dehydrogenase (short-subunit alcohol dehydrogenase family)